MKTIYFLSFIFVVVFSTTAQQKVALHHIGTTTIFSGSNPLIDAYTAAVANDTIYLPGGTFAPPANFDKKIAVFGTGHYEIATVATGKTFINGNVILKENADNFYIDKSDSIAESLLTNLGFLEKGTIGIAFITLIGAAIGLMNIMLVAVNERTKEIGLSKALGATRSSIRAQFLFESILISLMGALAGIISGVLLGHMVAVLLKTGFVIPWPWVIAGIFVCFVVGLFAGLYPALKASKLDPIVALRYE